MTMKDNNNKERHYTISSSLNENEIMEYCKSILSSPSIEISGSVNKSFYDTGQLIEMFRYGYEYLYTCELNGASISRQLREMEVGDKRLFPFRYWESVRSIASILKKTFGSLYKTRKLGTRKEEGFIEIERVL